MAMDPRLMWAWRNVYWKSKGLKQVEFHRVSSVISVNSKQRERGLKHDQQTSALISEHVLSP